MITMRRYRSLTERRSTRRTQCHSCHMIATILLALLGSGIDHPRLSNGWITTTTTITTGKRTRTNFITGTSDMVGTSFGIVHDNKNDNSNTITMGLRGKKIRKEKRRAMQEPTPPRIQTPYGPIRYNKPPRICECCIGRGIIRCTVCEGRGVIRATGHKTKKNSIQSSRLLGSKWTSVEVYNGHRHHKVIEVRGSPKSSSKYEVRMLNCCGERNDFWISVNDELKNKNIWRMGWITLEEIQLANGGPLLDVRQCFRCKGQRILHCIECDGMGTIPSYEPLHE